MTKKTSKQGHPVIVETKPGRHKQIGDGESENWNVRAALGQTAKNSA